MNSEEEAEYRLTLAQGYLERAEEASKRGDHFAVISNSQLAVENSAKAVISCFRIPSGSHDPSSELLEVAESNRDKIGKRTGINVYHAFSILASHSSNLAPEYGRMSYVDPNLRIPPWDLANAQRAKEALSYARESVEIAKNLSEDGFR